MDWRGGSSGRAPALHMQSPEFKPLNSHTHTHTQRINKMWFVHTMDYYLGMKGKEILTHVTMRLNLEALC
jgi:hypothetical protein